MLLFHKNRFLALTTVLTAGLVAMSVCFPAKISASAFGSALVNIEGRSMKLPIVMYHTVSTNSSLLGEWGITPEEFENDLKYIRDNGYTTVTMAEVIAFVYFGVPLPEKPVVLSFDDGAGGIYHKAFPLLQKYQMKAVLAIVGEFTDKCSENPNKSGIHPNITWDQINEMQDTGLVEIQNHSYNLHGSNGAKKLSGESESQYRNRLAGDLLRLQDRIFEMTGTKATTFAYPLGKCSKQSNGILKELGLAASFSCYSKTSTITSGDETCLYSLGRVLRKHKDSTSNLFKKLEA